MPQDNDNIKNLYEALKDEYDLGTEQDFRKSLSDGNNRRNLYNSIKDEYDVGSEDDFNNSLGYGGTAERSKTYSGPEKPMSEGEYNKLSESGKEAARGMGIAPQEKDETGLTDYDRNVIETEVMTQLALSRAKMEERLNAPSNSTSGEEQAAQDEKEQQEWERMQHEKAVKGAAMKEKAMTTPRKPKEPTEEQKQRMAEYGEYVIENARRNTDAPNVYKIDPKDVNSETIDINTGEFTDKIVNEVYARADAEKKRLTEKHASDGHAMWGDDNGMTDAHNAMESSRADDPQEMERQVLEELEKNKQAIMNNAAKRARELQTLTDKTIDVENFAKAAYRATMVDLIAKVRNRAVEREMPVNTFTGVAGGIDESIAGNLASSLTQTPGHVKARQEAAARWRENAGMWSNVGRSTVSFVADMPFFGVSGNVSGMTVEQIAKAQLAKYVARGLSEKAAARVIETKLANSFGRRIADTVMKGVIGGAVNMGTYEAMGEAARQYAVQEYKPEEIMKAVAHGAAMGSALGVTGSMWGELTAKMSGAKKILANAAGFGIEAGTFTATGELEKWATGHSDQIHWLNDLAENALMVMSMKASKPKDLLKIFDPRARQEPNVPKFSDAEKVEILGSRGGRELYDLLSGGKATKQEYAEAYARFLQDPEVSFTSKQKVSYMLTESMQRKTPEVVTYDITPTDDGRAVLRTKAVDGMTVETMEFNSREAAELYGERLTAAIMQGETTKLSLVACSAAAEEIRREMKIPEKRMKKILTGEERSEEADKVMEAVKDRFILLTTEREMKESPLLPYQKALTDSPRGGEREVTLEGNTSNGTDRMRAAYDAAHEATDADVPAIRTRYEEAKAKVMKRFGFEDAGRFGEAWDGVSREEMAERLNEATEGDKEAMKDLDDFFEAEEAYRGMADGANERAEAAVEESNNAIDIRVHKDGMLHPLYLKAKDENGQDRMVYLVDGTVEMMDDGSMVDKEKSSKDIIVVDETGKKEFMTPDDVLSVGPVNTSPEAEKEAAAAEIRERMEVPAIAPREVSSGFPGGGEQEVAPEGVGTNTTDRTDRSNESDRSDRTDESDESEQGNVALPFELNDEFKVRTEDGREVGGSVIEGVNADGLVTVETDEPVNGKKVALYKPEELQGMVTEYNGEKLKGGKVESADEGDEKSDNKEGASYTLSDKVSDNGEYFYQDENGNIDLALIPQEVFYKIGVKAAPFRLIPSMLKHVFDRHGKEMGLNDPQDAIDFVLDVMDNFDHVRQGNNGALIFSIENGRNRTGRRAVTVLLSSKGGDYYGIKTSGYERIDGLNKKALLWEKGANKTSPTDVASANVSTAKAQQGNGQSGSASNMSNASTGKDSEKYDTAQETGENIAPMPMLKDKSGKETGEPDWLAATPERAHSYIYKESGLPKEVAGQLVKNNIEAARKRLETLKKKEPQIGTSIAKYNQDKEKWQEQQKEAQATLDFWNMVKAEQDKMEIAARKVQAEKDAAEHDKAVEEERQRKEAEAKAAAEREAAGKGNPMPEITERWKAAPKVDGVKDEIVLPNGDKVAGHYVLTESGAASASHDALNGFRKTDGFPMDENGGTVNDRDYERDTDAQDVTRRIAENYDSRALQTPVVVSQDGVVLSGNGRTMAGELAARDNTDKAYIAYLKEYAGKYGFTAEQVEGMEHPRVVFVPDVRMAYTAETFSKFNQQEMKSQSKTEQAVKMGKIVDRETFGRIVRSINAFDTLGEFYNDATAAREAIKELQAAGVITPQQMAEMFDGDGISAHGRELLENTLIGKAFENHPDAVRMITEFKSMRQGVITALSEIVNNISLGRDYSLESELAEAVRLVYEARHNGYKAGEKVSSYARQGNLFQLDDGATVADYTNATVMMLSDLLNDVRSTQLRKTLAIYNANAHDAANGQMDIFSGGVKNKEEIIKDVLKLLNNGTETEQQTAVDNATERRKAKSVNENESDSESDDGSETAANSTSTQNTTAINTIDPRSMSDEERQRRGELLAKSSAIDVPEKQITSSSEMTARQAAEKWWDDNVPEPVKYETEIGTVEINKNSVQSSLAHRYGQAKLDTITSLVEGFGNAVYLGTMPDGNRRGVQDHYFAYPINYKGEHCYVFCRVMQDLNKNSLYVHEVFIGNKIEKGDTLQTAASKPHGGISLYKDILANVLEAASNGKDSEKSETEQGNGDESYKAPTNSPRGGGQEVTPEGEKTDKRDRSNGSDKSNTKEGDEDVFRKAERIAAEEEKKREKDESVKKIADTLKGKGPNATSGPDLKTLLEEGAKVAGYYIGKGAVKFADFAKKMYEDLRAYGKDVAEAVKPYLRKIYDSVVGGFGLKDMQGNPIDGDGKYILHKVKSVEELKDEDFTNAQRNVELPKLPENVANALGTGGKPVIIKKNIFEKNWRRHGSNDKSKGLTPAQSRKILSLVLYDPDLYGQNQKVSRPYNWILVHLDSPAHESVILEVNPTKDNVEIVNWHYLRPNSLKQKESQAIKEGGLILNLPKGKPAGTTAYDSLTSVGKDKQSVPNEQGKSTQSGENAEDKTDRSDKSNTTDTTADVSGNGDVQYMFAGEKGAERADKETKSYEAKHRLEGLHTARGMEQAGEDARAIKMATGWERGADGKWRYEINDNLSVKEKALARVCDDRSGEVYKLNDLIDNKELMSAYPELSDVEVRVEDSGYGGTVAEYKSGPLAKEIIIHNPEYVKNHPEVLIHEVQHVIQDIEGFAQGGNTGDAEVMEAYRKKRIEANENKKRQMEEALADMRKEREALEQNKGEYSLEKYEAKAREIDGRIKSTEYWINEMLVPAIKSMKEKDFTNDVVSSREAYNNLMGEVEARNAARRNGMGFEDRRKSLAEETEDVARKDQIYLREHAPSTSSEVEDVGMTRNLREQQKRLGEAVTEMLKEAGVEVSTDVEEMKKVILDGNVQYQARLSALGKAAQFIRNALKAGKAGGEMRIELPEVTRKKIRNVMGRDFDSHSINIGGVRHGLKNHGVKGKKLSENSIPLSQEDAELIPYILTAPDRVTKGSDDFSRESIRFYKTLSNGYVVVVEKEKNNSPNDMETINIWAERTTNVADAYSRLNYPGATSKNVTISGNDAAKIRKDAENAIAQDEILQKMTLNHDSATNTEYLKTSKGEVYGFVKDGKIYIDPSLMNPNTPLHEYTHLFDKAVQQKNPELWARGKEVMKELPLWKEVETDPAYSDIKDDEDRVASEVHARLTGEKGAKYLEDMVDEARKKGPFEMAETLTLVERVKQWLKDFVKSVRDAFSGLWDKAALDKLSADEWGLMPVKEILLKVEKLKGGKVEKKDGRNTDRTDRSNGSDRTYTSDGEELTDEESQIVTKAKADGSFMKAPNGEPTNLTEKQWVQVRTKPFKDWFGDWEEDPENASKAVDENGEPKVFYHNTDSEFTVFDQSRNGSHTDAGWLGDGFYFYGDQNEGDGYGKNKMPVYLNVREPYYATSEENERLAEANSREESVEFREEIEGDGYDGVYYNGDLRQEAVVFYPNQIKSATENRGTFSSENDDIQFMTKAPSGSPRGGEREVTPEGRKTDRTDRSNESNRSDGNDKSDKSDRSDRTDTKSGGNYAQKTGENIPEYKKELIAVHNTSAEQLKKTLLLGGFPMPSIAVTKATLGHSQFGDISLVFDKSSIDPKNKKNKVYSGDAWTPIFPDISLKINEKVRKAVVEKIRSLVDRSIKDVLPLPLDAENVRTRIERRGGDVVSALADSEQMKYAYLKSEGMDIDVPMKGKNYGMADVATDVIKKHGLNVTDIYDNSEDIYYDESGKYEAFKNDMRDAFAEDKLKRTPAVLIKNRGLEALREKYKSEYSFNDFDRMVSEATIKERDMKTGGGRKVDVSKLKEKLNDMVKTDDAGYREWINGMFSGIVAKEGIRNKKDTFTSSGLRRKWEYLYDAVTLKNVMKAMLSEEAKGNGILGGNIYGAATREYGSIEELRADARRLVQEIAPEQVKAAKEVISARFGNILSRMAPGGNTDVGKALDAMTAVTEAVKHNDTAEGFYKELKKRYPKMTMADAESMAQVVDDIRKMPTDYLEAKPRRAVGFDEVKAAVVPEGTSEDVVKALKDKGVKVITYKAGDEADRRAKVEQVSEEDGLLFRLGDPAETFEARQKAAVENKGTVMPGLSKASVEVTEVPRHTYEGTAVEAKKQAMADAKANYIGEDGKPKVQHYDNFGQTFDYTISGASIDESMNRKSIGKSSNMGAHIAVLNHLPEVIGNSIEVEEHPDYIKNGKGVRDGKGVNNDVLIHRFYGAVKINGESYRVRTTMKEYKDTNRNNGLYTYEVTNVELLVEGSTSSLNGVPRSPKESLAVAKLLQGVEKSYDTGKKLLDESKDLTVDDLQRTAETFEDGEVVPIDENDDLEISVRGLNGWYDNERELLEAFRDKYPEYVATVTDENGQWGIKVEPWSKYLKGNESLPAHVERKTKNARTAVAAMADKMHLDNIEVRTSTEGMKGKAAKAKGWFDPKTGKIVIVLPNHTSVGDVVKTLLHEGVAHFGLRKMFGKNFDNFLDNVFANAEEGIREKIKQDATRRFLDALNKGKEMSWEQAQRVSTEEYLAGLAEDTNFENIPETFWSKIKDWFLDMLHKIGLKGVDLKKKLTDNDLRYILWRSYKNMTEPGRYRNVFEQAEDVAMRERLLKVEKLKGGKVEKNDGWKTDRTDMSNGSDRSNTAVAEGGKVGERKTKTATSEGPGAVSGTASSDSLNPSGEVHLSRYASTQTDLAAKLRQNFKNILGKVKNFINGGYRFKSSAKPTANDVVRKIGDAMGFRRSESSNSYYGEFAVEQEFEVGDKKYKVRISTHPANGENMSKGDFDERVSIVVYKNGEHKIDGTQPYTEHVYSLDQTPRDVVVREIADGVKSMLEGGHFKGEHAETVPYNEDGSNVEEDDNLLYREEDEPEATDRVKVRDEYERKIASSMYQAQEAMQDSMLSLKTLMNDVLKASGKKEAADFENAYMAENAMSSKNQAEAEAYKNVVMKPLLKEVSKLKKEGATQEEITDYMMAKHGLERNEEMARRAAEAEYASEKRKVERELQRLEDKFEGDEEGFGDSPEHAALVSALDDIEQKIDRAYEENRQKDYAGLTALTDEDDVATAEEAARQMVETFESGHDTDELWKKTNAATKATLSKIYESGLLSKSRYEDIRDMYENYIPLRGWDDTTSDEVYSYLTSKDGAMRGSIMKKAAGRRSKADDPIATIAAMAEAAISQGNRNQMKQKFLNFVLNNPSDAVSVSSLWLKHDEVTDEWKPVFPDLDKNDDAATVEKKIADFEAKMKELKEQEPDKYKHGRDAAGIPYVVKPGNQSEHQVLVQRGGKTTVLTINGNPRAAQALNGLTNPNVKIEGAVGAILNVGEYVNRQMSAFYTTRNPGFVASNFIRDTMYSNSMVWVKESPNYALRFHKNFAKYNPTVIGWLLNKYANGTLNMSSEVESMFYQFMMNGGETGYTVQRDIEAHKKAVRRELSKMGSRIPVRKALALLGERFDDLNRAVENAARFAAFATSREMGRSVERSVWDAKEISVNFNKKGSGAKFLGATGQTKAGNISAFISGSGRIGYVFWNAAIQGTYNFGKAIGKHPTKGMALLAAAFLLGTVVPMLGGDGDGDDEKNYYNLPEFVRRSNICFRIGDKWVTIPLSVEMRTMYGMGELAMSVMSGNEKLTSGEIAVKIAEQLSQAMPLDLMEGGGGLSALIPSSIKPMAEIYSNKDWTGLPIYKDTPFNKNMPEWTKAYTRTNKTLVWLSRRLNELTGGDDFKKGGVDINPAIVEHLLEGAFGGVATTINQMVQTGEMVAGERKFDWRNVPIASRLIKSADERTQMKAVNENFFHLRDEYEETKRLMRAYQNAADEGAVKYAEKLDFLNHSKAMQRYEIMEEYMYQIDWLKDEQKYVKTDAEKQRVQDEMDRLKVELVERMRSN